MKNEILDKVIDGYDPDFKAHESWKELCKVLHDSNVKMRDLKCDKILIENFQVDKYHDSYRAWYKYHALIGNRHVVIVDIEAENKEGKTISYRQPFYRSTGRNSGHEGYWFPFAGNLTHQKESSDLRGLYFNPGWFMKYYTEFCSGKQMFIWEDHHRYGQREHGIISKKLKEIEDEFINDKFDITDEVINKYENKRES